MRRNISKSSRRSNHKHCYKQVLIETVYTVGSKNYNKLVLGKQCTICDRLVCTKWFFTEPSKENSRIHKIMDNNKIRDMHPNLPIVKGDIK